jgi:hypothetical protein
MAPLDPRAVVADDVGSAEEAEHEVIVCRAVMSLVVRHHGLVWRHAAGRVHRAQLLAGFERAVGLQVLLPLDVDGPGM